MNLRSGCRITVAPHFHLLGDWPGRLLVGSGVEEVNGAFLPRDSWRAAGADELELLLRESKGTPPEELEESLILFQVPGHLGAAWWRLLEQGADLLGNGRLPGYDAFVGQVSEFLAFKDLPVPAGSRCDVVVTNSERQSIAQATVPNGSEGFCCNLAHHVPWPCSAEDRRPRLWGGINLGDDETSVGLINLPCAELDAELRRRATEQPPPKTIGELTRQFLRACPDYPPIRLPLRSGEGCRLPRGGLLLDWLPGDNSGPGVMLLIFDEICPCA